MVVPSVDTMPVEDQSLHLLLQPLQALAGVGLRQADVCCEVTNLDYSLAQPPLCPIDLPGNVHITNPVE